MAKARARAAARKVKDKWKAKNWYQIQAPPLFDNIPVAETLAEKPSMLKGRVTGVSLQDLTGDFRKSHIKLFFRIHNVEESTAHTQLAGSTLTSDYIRRMIRRRRSRIDGIYDVNTRDGAQIRVKPFATTERRIQSSQKKVIREVMKKTITDTGKALTLNEFFRDALDGKLGSDVYKNCKNLYPVKRVEIYKIEVNRQPTIEIEDTPKKKPKAEEPSAEQETPEKEPKEKAEKQKKEEPEKQEEEKTEKPAEEPKEKPVEKPETKDEEPKKPAEEKKPAKKTPAKKPATKKTTKKASTKTKAKKTTTKKKATKTTTKKKKTEKKEK